MSEVPRGGCYPTTYNLHPTVILCPGPHGAPTGWGAYMMGSPGPGALELSVKELSQPQKALRGVIPASLCLVVGAILWEIAVQS